MRSVCSGAAATAVLLMLLAAPPPAGAVVDPAALYHDYCSVCHGDAGDGRSHATGLVPPPRDFTTPGAAAELSRERMIASVSEGRPGTAMAPWKAQLVAEQIVALVDYIRGSFMKPVTSAELGSGRRLYAENCSVCHGDDGRGAMWTRDNMSPAPRDFTSERAVRELSRERMLTSVTFGRADTAMPGFGAQLATADIETVVDYVRETFVARAATAQARGMADAADTHGHAGEDHQQPSQAGGGHAHASHAMAADMGAAAPHGLQPDLARGEAYYRENCTACHGRHGDGQGPRAYFILPKPRNFTHPASRSTLNRPALFDAISAGSVGTEMPAWRTVLDEQTIADVAEYVFTRFVRPGAQAAGAQ